MRRLGGDAKDGTTVRGKCKKSPWELQCGVGSLNSISWMLRHAAQMLW